MMRSYICRLMFRFSTSFLVVCALVGFSCGGNVSGKADALFEKGSYEEAIAEYDKLLANNPTDFGTLYNRGRAYEELKKFDQAEADFLQVIKLDEKNQVARLSLSKLHYQKEQYPKALLWAQQVLEINENSAQAHFLIARAKHQLGYVDGAMESYSLAIKLDNNYGEAYLYRGALKIHKKQSRSACEDFIKAEALEVAEATDIRKKYCK